MLKAVIFDMDVTIADSEKIAKRVKGKENEIINGYSWTSKCW
jgi:hypothetical protein